MSTKVIQLELPGMEQDRHKVSELEFKESVEKCIRSLFYRNHELEKTVLAMNKKLTRVSDEVYKHV